MIPLQKMGRPKGFEPHVIPCCAGKYLWSSTKKIITNPFTRIALSSKLPIRSGGILVQPMYWTDAITTMRQELKVVGMNPIDRQTGPKMGGVRRK